MTTSIPAQAKRAAIEIAPSDRGVRGFLGWLLAPERRGALLVTPAIVTLVVVNIFPLLWSYGLSFFSYNAKYITRPPRWNGLGNYIDLFTDPEVWGRFQNTAVIVLGSVSVQLVVGFLLALLFAKEFPLRRYLLMLVLAPMMLSLSAVGVFFKLFYEPTFGFIPRSVQAIQFWLTGIDEPVVILDTPVKATLAIIFADAWMWSPFVMLLVLAGLVSVPKYLYEAAEIDRASAWRRFSTITFPYIRSLLLLALLFRTIETFKIFDVPYVLTEGGPGTSTETISVYLFRVAFNYFRTGSASALGYIVLFGVIVLTSLYLYAIQSRAGAEPSE
jgi:multiple sugar transport system permease protein